MSVEPYLAELSGENPELATAEVRGAVHGLGGGSYDGPVLVPNGWVAVGLRDDDAARRLAERLALARRIVRPWTPGSWSERLAQFTREGARGGSAAFRPLELGRSGSLQPPWTELARAFQDGGGTIDLVRPDRKFAVGGAPPDGSIVAEVVAEVDRRRFASRRMPNLPFRRPVSLPPRLARVAANLSGVAPGACVIDPFVGTGALLIEAALAGARVSGVDRDPEMVRGALRNLAYLGIVPDSVRVADAADTFPAPTGSGEWDAVVTDPPYGRASGSAGEPPERLIARVLPRWAERLRRGGRIVVILPGGPDPLPAPWVRLRSIPDRVHRSLTREFRVYGREGEGQ